MGITKKQVKELTAGEMSPIAWEDQAGKIYCNTCVPLEQMRIFRGYNVYKPRDFDLWDVVVTCDECHSQVFESFSGKKPQRQARARK